MPNDMQQPQFLVGSSPAIVAENVKLLKGMGYDEQQATAMATRLAGGAKGADVLGIQLPGDMGLPNQTGSMDPRLMQAAPAPQMPPGTKAVVKPSSGLMDTTIQQFDPAYRYLKP